MSLGERLWKSISLSAVVRTYLASGSWSGWNRWKWMNMWKWMNEWVNQRSNKRFTGFTGCSTHASTMSISGSIQSLSLRFASSPIDRSPIIIVIIIIICARYSLLVFSALEHYAKFNSFRGTEARRKNQMNSCITAILCTLHASNDMLFRCLFTPKRHKSTHSIPVSLTLLLHIYCTVLSATCW